MVKIRWGDRSAITRSHTLASPVDAPRPIAAVAGSLLRSVDVSRGVRLLGVSVANLVDALPGAATYQLVFDLLPAGAHAGAVLPAGDKEAGRGGTPLVRTPRWDAAADAVARVRARYGAGAVASATLIGPGGMSVRRRGDTQWGPRGAGIDDPPVRGRDGPPP